jgi:hypothetical protein
MTHSRSSASPRCRRSDTRHERRIRVAHRFGRAFVASDARPPPWKTLAPLSIPQGSTYRSQFGVQITGATSLRIVDASEVGVHALRCGSGDVVARAPRSSFSPLRPSFLERHRRRWPSALKLKARVSRLLADLSRSRCRPIAFPPRPSACGVLAGTSAAHPPHAHVRGTRNESHPTNRGRDRLQSARRRPSYLRRAAGNRTSEASRCKFRSLQAMEQTAT